MTDKIQDCFRSLDLDATASPEEVKNAWLEFQKFYHPDRFQHDPKLLRSGQEKIKKINAAYDTLKRYFASADYRPPQVKTQPSPRHSKPKPPEAARSGSHSRPDTSSSTASDSAKQARPKPHGAGSRNKAQFMFTENGWQAHKARSESQWGELRERGDVRAGEIERWIHALFAEPPFSNEFLDGAYEEFCATLKSAHQNPGQTNSQVSLEGAIRHGTFKEMFVERATSLGWCETEQLRIEIETLWRESLITLTAESRAQRTQNLVDESRIAPAEASDLAAAFFDRALLVARFWDEDMSAFLRESAEKDYEAEEGEPHGFPKKFFFTEAPKLIEQHLAVARIVEERRQFWDSDKVDLFHSSQPADAASQLSPQRRRRPWWLRLLWWRNKTSVSAQVTQPWQEPLLEKAPKNMSWWHLLYNRRNECVRDSQALDIASKELDDLLDALKRRFKEIEDSLSILSKLDPAVSADDEFKRADELIGKHAPLLAEARLIV